MTGNFTSEDFLTTVGASLSLLDGFCRYLSTGIEYAALVVSRVLGSLPQTGDFLFCQGVLVFSLYFRM